MSTNIFAVAGLTLALMAGSAMAQTSQDSGNVGGNSDTTATDNPTTFMSDKTKMGAFYTDDSMTTMKTGDAFKSAFMALSSDDQASARKDCENTTSMKDEFCESIKNIQ